MYSFFCILGSVYVATNVAPLICVIISIDTKLHAKLEMNVRGCSVCLMSYAPWWLYIGLGE